jgi:hypothetical protein
MSDQLSPIPAEHLAPPHEPITSSAPMQEGARGAAPTVACPPPAPSDMDETAKQSFLWHTHDYLGEYARFADTKAAFSGTISGALIGFLYNSKIFIPMVSTSFFQWSSVTWLGAIAGLFLLASVVLTLLTVYPHLKSTRTKGFVYWGNIAAFKKFEVFQGSFHSQSPRTLNDGLLIQAFDISKHVLIPKYRVVSWCLITLTLGAVFAAGTLLLKDRVVASSGTRATQTAIELKAP